ncbi:MAG TPA: 4-hydroxy-tetrahydrodipicolinate synthase [Euzebyales bacterium]|nr:4-hydroxy-tetrahydrodipicolinate synthase [Euzebyales bacterium]
MPAFGQVLTAMATPMLADGGLDLDGAQKLAHHLVEHGNDGVVVAGTTGESPTLTHDETLDLCSAVVEAVGGHATVVAGVGKNDTAATVELAGQAAGRGVDGIMLVTPYYNRPPVRGLQAHFARVAAAVDLPVLLYNIPARTAAEIPPHALLALAERVPNIVAVKDAVKNLDKAAWLIARKPDDFDVYAGNDIDYLPLLAVGAAGVVSVAGHFVADRLARLGQVFPEDPAAARRLHLQLLPLFEALFVDSNPVPLKAGLDMVGLPGGPVRPPLADAEEQTVAAMRAALASAGMTFVATS